MSIIRRLVLKEWFKAFFAGFCVLLILLTVGNLIAGLLRGNVTGWEVLTNYILELPVFLNQILPVSCLIASVFSLDKLHRRNELVAVFASGITRLKLLLIIVQGAVIVAGFQFLIGAYLRPFLKGQKDFLMPDSKMKFRNLKSKGLRASTIASGKIWYKGDDYFLSFFSYDKINRIINQVSVYYFDKYHKLQTYIHAKKVVHYKEKTWNFITGKVYSYLNISEFPQISSFDSSLRILDETPDDFNQLEADITTLTPDKLISYIEQLKKSGINTSEYEVVLYDKFSQVVICIVFALLSSLIIFHPDRRTISLGKNVFFVLVFTVVYWLIHFSCLELGKTSKINPFMACFFMPLLLSIFLFFYFSKNRPLKVSNG